MRRVAIFGGTFDPIHFGHLRAAEEVCERFELDEVRLVPAADPPHKTEQQITAIADRLQMVEMAIADNPNLSASRIELDRDGPSYTIHTLERILEQEPAIDLHFVVGRDTFDELDTWRDCERLLEIASMIVVSRPGSADELPPTALPEFLRQDLVSLEPGRVYEHSSGHRLLHATITPLDISSSQVRALVSAHRSIRYLVPEPVAAAIHRRGLYQT